MHPASVLLVTLDSCRYDTFVESDVPALRSVGPVHRAMAPAHFTYASHLAMFVGFTPGVATAQEKWVNPKYGRIFRLTGTSTATREAPFVALAGRTIVDGFRQRGYRTIGAAAMRWFDPATAPAQPLIQDFDDYQYEGRRDDSGGVESQVAFLQRAIDRAGDRPVFVFLNVGETHVPYYYNGAPWDRRVNPCLPFAAADNDAEECRRRQRGCLEFVDGVLAPLLDRFAAANVVICSDHGDAWGEDGLWEHGVSHPKVLEVPLLLRLSTPPPRLEPAGSRPTVRGVKQKLRRLRAATP